MLKKIKVLDYDGKFWSVWAWVEGNLAVHHAMATPGRFWDALWSITHVPTGMGIRDSANSMQRERVAAEWEKAKSFVWNGVHPLEDLAACELLELTSLLAKDNGVPQDMIEDWNDTVKPIAVQALRCKEVQP